jgi:hypothetical protein
MMRNTLHAACCSCLRWSLWLLLAMPLVLQARDFTVTDISTLLRDDSYYLNAQIDYRFSDEVLEALENGIALEIRLDVSVNRVRPYIWDEEVSSIELYYELKYHALTEHYVLRNLTLDNRETFTTRQSAISALGRINELKLIRSDQLLANETYQIELQPVIGIESLPAPLRPWAWLSTDWHFKRDGQPWPLH